MAKDEIRELLNMFEIGAGFGDPEARRNAELRVQVLFAREQRRAATKLNWLTFLLVVVGLLNAAVLAVQVWAR